MKEKGEPTFLDQAYVLIEGHYATDKMIEDEGHWMSIRDHKLNVKILDLHMQVIRKEIDDQNDKFKKGLLADVVDIMDKQWQRILTERLGVILSEKLNEFGEKMDLKFYGIEKQITDLSIDVNHLKKRNSWMAIAFRLIVTSILTIIAAILFFIMIHNRYLT
jgi:hypothetical protein